jgi:glycosyltransferase involved in cell wall biosynthesis
LSGGMRLFLDLRACQADGGGGERGASALALARALAARADQHQVFVALDGGLPGRIPLLKDAFSDLVPPERVVVYGLPWGPGDAGVDPWRRHTAALLRRAFFEWRGASAVLECDWTAWPEGHRLSSLAPAALTPVVRAATIWPGDPHPGMEVDVALPPHDSAAAATAALVAIEAAVARRRSVKLQPVLRPNLAVVGPLPPADSPSATQAAALLPALARYYHVEAVVDQRVVEDRWIADNLAVRSAVWFDDHAAEYDRIVYHVADSPAHVFALDLLARHPGVVALHHTPLPTLLGCLRERGDDQAFAESLYEACGYSALVTLHERGPSAVASAYPCSAAALRGGAGLLVDSFRDALVLEALYGEVLCSDVGIVPPLVAAPAVIPVGAAREELGLSMSDFLVCAFAAAGSPEADEVKRAWEATTVSGDPTCRLVFVPTAAVETRDGDHRIACLSAADVAVVWSAGAGVSDLLECLACGLPVVIARPDGDEAAALPEDAALQLPAGAGPAELAQAIERLREDPGLADSLRAGALRYVQDRHGAEAVAARQHEAIEAFAIRSRAAVYQRLLEGVAAAPSPPTTSSDVLRLAGAVSAARPRVGARQWLVDVTELAVNDYRTGVQRVSRAVLANLIADSPTGYRIEPVRGTASGHRYARRYAHALLGLPDEAREEAPVDARPGDRFLGLDLSYEMVRLCEPELIRLRDLGVRLDFVIYDMLPVLRPHWFPDQVPREHLGWLRTVAAMADGLICISATVAGELLEWLDREPVHRSSPLDVGYFGLGADLAASAPSTGGGRDGAEAVAFASARPTFLMVGTVEPRKGHAQALSAFEELWAAGVDCGLVIVGKEGWNVGDLASRLRVHRERGRRLLWLDAASDEVLQAVYGAVSALLAPSEGEGFGLPLVEAAQHGVPVIARDLPVFKEVAGDRAFYFHGSEPAHLAAAVRAWLDLDGRGEAPQSGDMPWLTWAESTRQLVDCVAHGGWQASWVAQRGG